MDFEAWSDSSVVNTTGVWGDSQSDARVAPLKDGGYVVVRLDENIGGGSNGEVVRGQRYDFKNEKVGNQFDVYGGASEHPDAPEIASRPDGGYVVVVSDVQGLTVAKEYDSGGVETATRALGNTDTLVSDIVVQPDGSYIVLKVKGPPIDRVIFGIRVDANGTIGTEFPIANDITATEIDPSAAGLLGGNTVVAYTKENLTTHEVAFQVLDQQGASAVTEVIVNTDGLAGDPTPVVAEQAFSGGFLVFWAEGGQIKGRIYDEFGGAVSGPEILVSTTAGASNPRVTNKEGTFVVTYDTAGGPRGQNVDASGNQIGAEFSLNSSFDSDVATLQDGRIVVVGSQDDFLGNTDIVGQIFDNRPSPTFGFDADVTPDFITASAFGGDIRSIGGDDSLYLSGSIASSPPGPQVPVSANGGAGNDIFILARNGLANTIEDFKSQYFEFPLEASQEVPPSSSANTGFVSAVLNGNQTRFSSNLGFFFNFDVDGTATPGNPNDDLTGIHIHHAPTGSNGPIMYGIFGVESDTNGDTSVPPGGQSFSFGWDSSEGHGTTLSDQITNLLNEELYVNVHSVDFPDGDIRGQIVKRGGSDDLIDVSGLNIGEFSTIESLSTDLSTGGLISTLFDGVTTSWEIRDYGTSFLSSGDFLWQVALDETRNGTGNDDDLFGAGGDDILNGFGGNDRLFGEADNDELLGNTGNDFLQGGAGDDILNGGAGTDTVSYKDATSGVEVYLNFGVSKGAAGNDTLASLELGVGSNYNDRIIGNSGNNTLYGENGDDILKGKGGNDTYFGGDGDDRIFGDNGVDIVYGGAGSDILYALAGNDILYGGSDRDFVYGGRDTDTVHGDDGDDEVRGNLGNDMIFGDSGEDDLRGGGNNDMLDGGDDGDFLFGENGLDTLIGGAGGDSLSGGSGGGVGDGFQDTFVYSATASGGGGFDRIKDMENSTDLIDLTSFSFADFAAVDALATDTGTGDMRINFGGGDVLYIENFGTMDFDASDVLI